MSAAYMFMSAFTDPGSILIAVDQLSVEYIDMVNILLVMLFHVFFGCLRVPLIALS